LIHEREEGYGHGYSVLENTTCLLGWLRRGKMDTTEFHSERNWEHVHRCPQCENIIKADEISHSAIATGVITCPQCNYSGPINVEIVPEEPGLS
jgi:hypothetical protein